MSVGVNQKHSFGSVFGFVSKKDPLLEGSVSLSWGRIYGSYLCSYTQPSVTLRMRLKVYGKLAFHNS